MHAGNGADGRRERGQVNTGLEPVSVAESVDTLVQCGEGFYEPVEGRGFFVDHGILHGLVVFLPGVADFRRREDAEGLREQGSVVETAKPDESAAVADD